MVERVELDIDALTWSEDIEEHFARHLGSHRNVMAVRDNDPLVYTNLPDRGGTHVMIGPDDLGRVLYISIRPADAVNAWQPVTGWESRLARRLWEDNKR
jgi:hypothetical protein